MVDFSGDWIPKRFWVAIFADRAVRGFPDGLLLAGSVMAGAATYLVANG